MLAAAVALCACERPATGFVVVVDGEMPVRERLRFVRVKVYSPPESPTPNVGTRVLAVNGRLPLTFSIGQADLTQSVRVDVEGFEGVIDTVMGRPGLRIATTPFIEGRAVGAFVPGKVKVLPVVLFGGCINRVGVCMNIYDTCDPMLPMSCRRAEYSGSQLVDFDAGVNDPCPLGNLREGATCLVPPDGSMMGMPDGSMMMPPPADAGMPPPADSGPPPQDNGSLSLPDTGLFTDASAG